MTIATLKKNIHVRPAGDSNKTFVFLMTTYGIRQINSQKSHAYYLELSKDLLKQLAADGDPESAEGIRHYLSLVTLHIRNYETERWPAEKTSGGEILEHLRKQQGLTQKDLKTEIGEQPYVSDIEKGKKQLTTSQIQKLSKRFGVSPSVFFE